MASLTHVCMWSDNGWKRITAEEAARLHPGGTVSAHSGLFMCELCSQYVILTDGDVRIRYFKHSAYEKSKVCPERTFGSGYSYSYDSVDHDLPIRIIIASPTAFRFEIGLIRAPADLLDRDFRVLITAKGQSEPWVFTKERLNYEGITYLPVGERPFEEYMLHFQNGDKKLYDFWPKKNSGIDPTGTLFDKASGKKLTYDADVEVEKEYYLLKRGVLFIQPDSMQIQQIMQKQFGWDTWTLYVVSASRFGEETARFYHDFHCRLTDHPVSLQPIWPLFVEGNYVIKHNQESLYMLVEGNAAEVKTFPPAAVFPLSRNAAQPKIYEVICSGRQQLISTGRTRALQYTYFWRERLDRAGSCPEISVTDSAGHHIAAGEHDTLPSDKILRFKSDYDGELIISISGRVADRRKISADKFLELDGLSYGLNIKAAVGLDVIWEADFKRPHSGISNEEADILKRITSGSGPAIPAPHSLRNILAGMQHYPLISQWIWNCIRNGTINERSYRRLQDFYRSVNISR